MSCCLLLIISWVDDHLLVVEYLYFALAVDVSSTADGSSAADASSGVDSSSTVNSSLAVDYHPPSSDLFLRIE